MRISNRFFTITKKKSLEWTMEQAAILLQGWDPIKYADKIAIYHYLKSRMSKSFLGLIWYSNNPNTYKKWNKNQKK